MADDTHASSPGIYVGDTNRRALAGRLRALARNPDPEDLPTWATPETCTSSQGTSTVATP